MALTLEKLTRFLELIEPETVEKKMGCLSNMIQYPFGDVRLGESRVHGRGVFTTRKFSKGEILTGYPGDIVTCEIGKTPPMRKGCTSERYRKRFGEENIESKARDPTYRFDLDEKCSIVGCPEFDEEPCFLGHFINDGAKPGESKKSVKKYEKLSLEATNCLILSIKNCTVVVVATRDIEKDEELFTHYTAKYWKSINKRK